MIVGFYTYTTKDEMESKAENLYSAGCDYVYKAHRKDAFEMFRLIIAGTSKDDVIVLDSLHDIGYTFLNILDSLHCIENNERQVNVLDDGDDFNYLYNIDLCLESLLDEGNVKFNYNGEQ